MKKILILAILGCYGAHVGAATPIPYSQSRIGVEIMNKARRPIWVAVVNGDKLFQPTKVDAIGGSKLIPKIATVSFPSNIEKPTLLAVYYNDPGRISYEKTKLGLGKEVFTPTPNRVFSFKSGPTIYLTWDPADFPRPQTGPSTGLTLKKGIRTESNLDLTHNVKQEDIKELPTAALT